MADGTSPADLAALTNDNGFGGNMGAFWIFALLLLAGGGFGGFGWGNRGVGVGNSDLVTQIDISYFNQTQAILGTQGRWVGWATSGSQAVTTTAG